MAGRRHAAILLATRPLPTAAFCSSNLLAIGLMDGLRAQGLQVPADFAVMGFDDIYAAQVTYSPLTTVHVDKEAIGRLAFRKFFEILQQPDIEPEKIIVPTRLMIRGSCGGVITQTMTMNRKNELEKQIEGGDKEQTVAIETKS